MNPPRISVVIPVYNAEAYIEDCLRGIAEQLPGETEIVTVDDVSTDRTAEIIQDLASSMPDARIRYFRQPENAGPSKARNAGMDVATGEYLTFVDADDRLAPDALPELLRVAEIERCDIAVGDLITFWDTEEGIHYRKYAGLEAQGVFAFGLAGPLARLPRTVYAVSAYAKLFRRDFIEADHMRFDETMKYAEDHRFIIPAYVRAERICVCPRVVYEYRKDNEQSLMARFQMSYFDCIIKVVQNNLPLLEGWPRYYYSRRLLEYELLPNVRRIGEMSREDAEHAFGAIRTAVMALDQRICRGFVREHTRLAADYRDVRLGAFRAAWLRHRVKRRLSNFAW